MIRRIFALVFATAILASCGNTVNKENSAKNENQATAEKVEFATFVANPDNYVGKSIIVEGKVVHVCMETGKKLFIVGENPDVRLYIQAGENAQKFPMELMGNTVIVEGKITKPVAATLSSEAEHKMKEGEAKMPGKACETETALAGQSSLADVVMEYSSHTVKQ